MDLSNDIIYAAYPNPDTKDPSFVRPIVRVNMKPLYDPAVLEIQMPGASNIITEWFKKIILYWYWNL